MRTLAIDTATAACSVALFDGGELVAHAHEVVGRGHAERLLPMIADLPASGRADRVLVDCGPGSFTGVRVGLAAARALGFGWGGQVAGYSSTALIAAQALAADPSLAELAVALTGGHGEWFVQCFTAEPFAIATELASLTPDAARAAIGARALFGTVEEALPALPDARAALRLPAPFSALPPSPIYGRAPDAKAPA
ncbi:tRNA (adenosine(37)-N6)-threonylcarbamoyltransferase complex dimerization subunit type 1 TsaB [Sphingomonas gilva]|uniref:tRNA (Adenosine(37)-N6)-threonylcarbamoyltransferase complex dimerization subunit type 1 TsaB n=1 Tax=Sphingomonas gilva TaxID=2305907 RepID=A0A396RP23_9SPHN|nr:tRNA (adenosine(37)-N6)-threonylcarbamoyltransferase complex dimerization subunit type 1 TsaB [Sphingomonas gilva]RHW18277.1 tRNA (adenosine(37)-N6)-threonylcarbamoyltransferase complex dimerization subunit type 1 TsaB [Sphingomonas gilva]